MKKKQVEAALAKFNKELTGIKRSIREATDAMQIAHDDSCGIRRDARAAAFKQVLDDAPHYSRKALYEWLRHLIVAAHKGEDI